MKPNNENDIVYLDKNGPWNEVNIEPFADCTILPCLPPEKDQVIRFFISGVQGVGKSYLANELIKDRLDYFPNKRVIIFSPFESDPSLDRDIEGKVERVDPWNYETEEFRDCIVVFDDIDSFPKEPVVAAMYKLCKTLLQAGRKQGTDVIFINHTLKNGQRTKYVIAESNFVAVFPNAGNDPQITSFLKDYCGLTKQAIAGILNYRQSRWAILHKAYPVYVLTQKKVYIPN